MEKTPQNLELILAYFPDLLQNQIGQIKAIGDLYRDWNSKINVISRKDIDSLYEKHVLHSLSIARFITFREGTQVIDIGTGGGFPGIPLAIVFPEVRFHLVDSIGKKLKVVQEIAQSTGLKNVTTQHIRAEEIKNHQFDYAVTRAVAPLKDLWQWSKPLLRKSTASTDKIAGTRFKQPGLICLKGGDLKNEIQESGTRPEIFDIQNIFKEDFFLDKHILFVANR